MGLSAQQIANALAKGFRLTEFATIDDYNYVMKQSTGKIDVNKSAASQNWGAGQGGKSSTTGGGAGGLQVTAPTIGSGNMLEQPDWKTNMIQDVQVPKPPKAPNQSWNAYKSQLLEASWQAVDNKYIRPLMQIGTKGNPYTGSAPVSDDYGAAKEQVKAQQYGNSGVAPAYTSGGIPLDSNGRPLYRNDTPLMNALFGSGSNVDMTRGPRNFLTSGLNFASGLLQGVGTLAYNSLDKMGVSVSPETKNALTQPAFTAYASAAERDLARQQSATYAANTRSANANIGVAGAGATNAPGAAPISIDDRREAILKNQAIGDERQGNIRRFRNVSPEAQKAQDIATYNRMVESGAFGRQSRIITDPATGLPVAYGGGTDNFRGIEGSLYRSAMQNLMASGKPLSELPGQIDVWEVQFWRRTDPQMEQTFIDKGYVKGYNDAGQFVGYVLPGRIPGVNTPFAQLFSGGGTSLGGGGWGGGGGGGGRSPWSYGAVLWRI